MSVPKVLVQEMYCKKTMVLWVLLLLVLVAIVLNVREGFNPATERPSETDEALRKAIEAFAGSTNYAVTTGYISSVQSFYDKVYLPDKKTPTPQQVQTFVDSETLQAGMTKPVLKQVIDYVFLTTETAPVTKPATENAQAAATTGGSSNAAATAQPSGAPTTKGKNIFGPTFTGFGQGDAKNSMDTSKTLQYPELLGGGFTGKKEYTGLPSIESTGSDEKAKFLPFSRSPGDMDLIPDPYRVSSTFTTSSYSSKTEPVPFLTDFSAFLK